ncbi:glucan phosphoethanolaminetransferase (alkaline phosphatase superfamily) [Bradyrhizobium elkanii]
MHRAIEARISQLTEIPVALYLTSILNAQDVLLKLGLPLIVIFLSGWIIIRRWVSTLGIAASGFSPAASSALFAPVLLIMYFYVLQSSMQEGIAAHAELVMLYGAIFAPTFFLLVPFGVASLIRVRRQGKPLGNGLLCIAFAAWPILQVVWMCLLFGEWE